MTPEQFAAQMVVFAVLSCTLFVLLLIAVIIATAFLNFKIKKITMATEQQFQAVIARIDSATNELAAEIKSLRDQIPGQGLSQEVEDRLLAGFTAVADKLEQVGKEPVPPTAEEGGSTGTDTPTDSGDSGGGLVEGPTSSDTTDAQPTT